MRVKVASVTACVSAGLDDRSRSPVTRLVRLLAASVNKPHACAAAPL